MHPVIHWPANQDQQENYLLILTISKVFLEDVSNTVSLMPPPHPVISEDKMKPMKKFVFAEKTLKSPQYSKKEKKYSIKNSTFSHLCTGSNLSFKDFV